MSKKQWYNILLFAWIVAFAAGGFAWPIEIGPAALTTWRFLSIFTIGVLVVNRDLVLYTGKYTRGFFFLLIIWITYGCASMLWVIDKTEAMQELFYLGLALCTYLVGISFYKKHQENFFKSITQAWLLGFFITAGIAIWEMITANHFSPSYTDKLMALKPFHMANHVPVVTFENPNLYAAYTVVSVAVLLTFKRWVNNYAVCFVVLFALLITFITKSRISQIALLLMLVMYFIFWYGKNAVDYWKKYKNQMLIGGGAFLLFIAFLLPLVDVENVNEYRNKQIYNDQIEEAIIIHKTLPKDDPFGEREALSTSSQDIISLKDTMASSTSLRKNLLLNGWEFIKTSKGLGVGAGNYAAYLEKGKGKYPVGTLRNPHNWVVEIVAQYGVIIFFLFAGWLLWVFLIFFKNVRNSESKESWKFALFGTIGIIGYLIISNANSSFMQWNYNWLMLVLFAIAADAINNSKMDKVAE
jgi:teichuronic acid biosynthesis protein TuaE